MVHKESAVVLIWNDKRELALQLRASTDDSYPSHWDFSVAGGIKEGETPYKAAVREMQEEVGVSGVPQAIGELLYSGSKGEDYLYFFRLLYNGSFTVDPAEVDDEVFFPLHEIARMIERGEKFHPEFLFAWNKGFMKDLVRKKD